MGEPEPVLGNQGDLGVMLDRPRVDLAIPRELGIHSAISVGESDDELPTYVGRDFDSKLRIALATNLPARGSFVVMVGGSSTGKTRSLYEAIYELVPEWELVQPADASALLDVKNAPPSRTVFWLDELQQYLGGHPRPRRCSGLSGSVRVENRTRGELQDERDS